jgi:hypothetical protein
MTGCDCLKALNTWHRARRGGANSIAAVTCKWATLHWIRFAAIQESLNLASQPRGCASWKIGPDGPVGPDGYRLPSNIWCAVGLYQDRGDADAALDQRDDYLPFLPQAQESWHAFLKPIAHRGECNHLNKERPGEMFHIEGEDPGGPLVVITTAGYNMGPDLNIERVIDFRRNVDQVRDAMRASDGNVAAQVFTPHTYGDDGFTTSIWRNDAAMFAGAYRPGEHRARIERHKGEPMADRTSFTRFRALRTVGSWNGADPAGSARPPA